MNDKKTIQTPLIVAISLAVGLFLGANFFGKKSGSMETSSIANKYKEILMHIQNSYVDKVDLDSLSNYGIEKMLEKLDPHTVYLPAKEAELANADLKDGFDGIGVEFNIFNDSLFVVSALSGGPSESAGIQTGDIILSADSVILTGKGLNSNKVFSNLRGPQNTIVKLKIKRKGYKTPLVFNVKRDKIPVFSIDAAYMIDKTTGYIKINRFSEATYVDFKKQLQQLKNKGMQRLMLDLRGNPGGYMDRATDIVDELVGGTDVIVFTKGQDKSNNYEVKAGHEGIFEKGKVVVLVDEGSASASEIVSGSLQDFDRATIVGRRTFGKGLVQAPIMLSDGSELRLTISRYYIPSGRGIQKPFAMGHKDDYYQDISRRHANKELFVQDSIKNNAKLKYKTKAGRTVYGGGGITPDVFVAEDTTYITPYLVAAFGNNIFREYSMKYSQANAKRLIQEGYENYLNNFAVSDLMLSEFNKEAQLKGVKFSAVQFQKSKQFIKTSLKALIARTVWKSSKGEGLTNEYYKVLNQNDPLFNMGLKQLLK